jgi:ribose-phosphate pyrophosphokinase
MCRARANEVDRMDLVGSVVDSDVVIVDDMIDTAGTLGKAADVLVANGGGYALCVCVCVCVCV